jgi:hypothetical protein
VERSGFTSAALVAEALTGEDGSFVLPSFTRAPGDHLLVQARRR